MSDNEENNNKTFDPRKLVSLVGGKRIVKPKEEPRPDDDNPFLDEQTLPQAVSSEKSDDGNVAPSKEERGPSKAFIYSKIAETIDRGELACGSQFFVVQPEPGIRLVLRLLRDNVVEFVKEEAVAHAIYKHTRYLSGYALDAAGAVKAKDTWIMATDPISEPKQILMKSEPGICYNRLPFDPIYDESKHPLFSEMLSRTTNAKAFAAFFGSLFYEKSDRSQYVWLFGEGDNGKGSWILFAMRVFGLAAGAVSTPTRSPGGGYDKHWSTQLIGKRLIAFTDVDDYTFVKSGLFKSITGNDRIPIERKFKDAYTASLSCKYIFASNERPQVGDQKADRKRIIYCEMQPFSGEADSEYNARVWQEAPYIIATCRKMYEDMCPTYGVIPTEDADELEAVIESNTADFSAVLSRYFNVGAFDENGVRVFFGPGCSVPAFADLIRGRLGWSYARYNEFIKWLRSRHKITTRVFKFNGKCERRYQDLFIRPDGGLFTIE
jgi:hypothetical protein